jgi:hypothetical protein
MLTPTTRLKLQAILRRIETAQPVTLQERIYLQKFASRDGAVASWVTAPSGGGCMAQTMAWIAC